MSEFGALQARVDELTARCSILEAVVNAKSGNTSSLAITVNDKESLVAIMEKLVQATEADQARIQELETEVAKLKYRNNILVRSLNEAEAECEKLKQSKA